MSLTFHAGGYLGEAEAYRDLGGFRLIESRYSQEIAMERHSHRQPFLHIVLQGCVQEEAGASPSEHTAMQIVFHPAQSPHATTWKPAGAGFAIEIGAERAAALQSVCLLPDRPVTLPASLPSGLMLAVRHELYSPDSAAAHATDGLVLEILAELSRLPGAAVEARAPRWLRRVRETVRATSDGPLSLTELARNEGVHPASLARAFRQHFGETVGDCLRRRRLDRACQEIAGGALSLSEIGHEAGFADQSHFTRTFKRHTGMTPSEYKIQCGLKKFYSPPSKC